MLVDQCIVEEDAEALPFDIDRGPDVLVGCLRRGREFLAEDVEHALAADKADEVIPPGLRFGQGVLWKDITHVVRG